MEPILETDLAEAPPRGGPPADVVDEHRPQGKPKECHGPEANHAGVYLFGSVGN